MTKSKKTRVMMSERGRPVARASSRRRQGVVCRVSAVVGRRLESTHDNPIDVSNIPDLPGGTRSVAAVTVLGCDGSVSEVGGQGKVSDCGGGEDDLVSSAGPIHSWYDNLPWTSSGILSVLWA
jgi:hypothetical protein